MEPSKVIIIGEEPCGFLSFGCRAELIIVPDRVSSIKEIIETQQEIIAIQNNFLKSIGEVEDPFKNWENPKRMPYIMQSAPILQYPQTGKQSRRERRKKDRKRKKK